VNRTLTIISISTAFILGCGGLDLFPKTDIEDLSLDDARKAGFHAPDGASHVYLRQRGTMDVQVTWARFELDEPAEATFRNTLSVHTWATHPAIPADWPSFAPFEAEEMQTPPSWWTPTLGAPVAFLENRASDQPGDSIGTGHYVILDGSRIYEWSWSFQWWGIGQ